MNKALSLILALMLCAALAVPAFAAETYTISLRDNALLSGVLRRTKEPLFAFDEDLGEQELIIVASSGATLSPGDDPDLPLYATISLSGCSKEVKQRAPYLSDDGTFGAFIIDKKAAFTPALFNDILKYPVVIPGKTIILLEDHDFGDLGFVRFEDDARIPASPSVSTGAPAIVLSPQKLSVDGNSRAPEMYNIGNTNFFGLRALRPYLGYEVDFDGGTNTAIVTTK